MYVLEKKSMDAIERDVESREGGANQSEPPTNPVASRDLDMDEAGKDVNKTHVGAQITGPVLGIHLKDEYVPDSDADHMNVGQQQETVHQNVQERGPASSDPVGNDYDCGGYHQGLQKTTGGCNQHESKHTYLGSDERETEPPYMEALNKENKPTDFKSQTAICVDKLHSSKVMQALKEQRNSGKICDVILKTRDSEYPVHRCVLMANSAYFNALLCDNDNISPAKPATLSLPCDNDPLLIDSVMEFMYTGRLSVNKDTIWEILLTAEKLEMDDLRQCCGLHLSRTIDLENWLEVFNVAGQFQIQGLRESVNNFLAENLNVVAQGTELLSFTEPDFKAVLTACVDEEDSDIDMYMLQVIIQWVQYSPEERIFFYQDLVDRVNIANLNMELMSRVFSLANLTDGLIGHPVTIALQEKVRAFDEDRMKEDQDSDRTEDYNKSDREYMPEDEEDWSDMDGKSKKRRVKTRPRKLVIRKKNGSKKKGQSVDGGKTSIKKRKPPGKKAEAGEPKAKRVKKLKIKVPGNELQDTESEGVRIKMELDEDGMELPFTEPKPKKKRGRPKKQISPDAVPIPCTKCTRLFDTPAQLRHHMKGHGSEIPYLCEICGFSTHHIATYNLHKRKHSGNVLRCTHPGCAYTAVRKTRMEDHINAHYGIKNHVCSTCGKAFFARKQLNRHEITLHGGNRYCCELCQYGSPRRDKLRYHMKKHHTEVAVSRGYIKAEDVDAWKAATNRPKSKKPKKARHNVFSEATAPKKPASELSSAVESISRNEAHAGGSPQPTSSNTLTVVPDGGHVRVQIPPHSTISEEMIQYLASYTAEQIQMHASEGHHPTAAWNYHVTPPM